MEGKPGREERERESGGGNGDEAWTLPDVFPRLFLARAIITSLASERTTLPGFDPGTAPTAFGPHLVYVVGSPSVLNI
jgi:hypothetical protein